MKIRKSKRFLAMLLSVLMVLTSLPIAAFTAFGAAAVAEDPAVTEVKAAMTAYETKLESGTIYTNMSAAYQAYVDCQKALDAYQYGSTKNDDGSYKDDFTGALSGKADALNNAVANMTAFTPYTGTAHGTFPSDKDYVSEDNYKENYKNILYSAPVTTTPSIYAENIAVTDAWKTWIGSSTLAWTADVSIFMSNDTVMLYDGITNPQSGVMLGTHGRTKHSATNWNNLAWYYCCIATGQGLSMVNDNWSGTDGASANGGWNLNYQWTIRQISNSKTGACSGTKVVTQYENGVDGKVTANAFQFNREFNTLIYTINNPSFEYRIGVSDRSDQKEYVTSTTNTVIRVLNYKMIMDAIDAQKGYLPNVENYKHGGLATVMQGFDQATTDPNSFFVSGNDWQGAQNHYQTAINNLKSAATADSSEYAVVRNGLKDNPKYMNTYNKGTNGWTADSWANYKAVYEKVAGVMSAPYTQGSYVAIENGQAYIDELDAAFEALVSNIEYADTTALVNVIQNFRSFENIFTADSYAFTAGYVDAAVEAVWKDEENFGIKTFGPEDTPEGNKLVADQLTLVNDSLSHLRISPDAQISTSHGRYSLNQALAIVVDNPSQYFNYNQFEAAVTAGNDYKLTLPNTEFTDYTTQYNAYVAQVQAIVDAYYNLAYAFTDIPDGTVVQNSGFTRTQPMVATDQGKQSIAFGYTNSAVMIRTTHEAKALPYGKFSITFGTNISASNNSDKQNNKNTNNGLDSITLNATQEPISDNFLQARENGGFLTDRKVPKELSAEQLAAYPGLLEYNGFSVSNLRYTGKSPNCDPLYYITDNDGNKVATTDEQARTIDLDPILGKTDGANNGNVVKGSVYAYSSNSGFAYTYIDGDLNVNVEPSPEVELTRSTQPSSKNYRLTGNYIGAVTSYTCRNTVYYAGRCWFTTKTAGDAMDTSVSVVDLSYLIDLVKICDQIVPLKSKYTEDSFAKFEQALYDAKAPYDYSKQSAGNIASEGSSRYVKLWSAYQNLVERPQILTFNYMDENGQPTSSTVEIAYNANIATVRSQIDAIVVPNYSLNGTSYTFKGWNPAVNNATVVTSDTTYTATYDSFATAYWGNYNAAKDTLLNSLANGKFSAEGLNEVKAQVEALQYFLYTDNQKLMVSASNQSVIDAEKSTIDAINAKLAEIALDSSTYDAVVKTLDTINADAYDIAAVEAIMTTTEAGTTVTIAGVDYTGWDYDNYVKTALEAMNNNAFKYTVLVYDIDYVPYYVAADGKTLIEADEDDNGPIVPEGAGHFKYGDTVVIQNPVTPGEACKFEVSIIAENTQVQTAPKYVGTLTEYAFNVRGNTEINTNAGETNDYVISFVDGRTNTLVYSTTSSTPTVSRNNVTAMINSLPTVPFYQIASLTNRVDGSDVRMNAAWRLNDMAAQGTKNVNITINYAPDEQAGYDIILLDVNGTEIHNAHYKWNQKVDLSAAGAAGMIDTATGKLIAYGSSYSFYACQSITLQAVNSTDGNVAVSVAAPVVSNGKVYFTGSFAKEGFDRASGATVKGYGIVMDTLGTHPDLTLKDVSNKNFVFNLAASSLTCGNQFTVYSNAPSMTTPINYRAYVIYEVNGTEVIEYSDVISTQIGG